MSISEQPSSPQQLTVGRGCSLLAVVVIGLIFCCFAAVLAFAPQEAPGLGVPNFGGFGHFIFGF